MLGEDCETGDILVTPHMGICRGVSYLSKLVVHLNAETFKACVDRVILPENRKKMKAADGSIYSVFGVKCKIFECSHHDEVFVDIESPPTARKLFGYLEESILKERLPKVWEGLKLRESFYGHEIDLDESQ